ncbi:MAG: hypothetical protein EOO88_53010 [Pedobacter sp.]|nr:MAG: hypothetical protein EOO88_53010 [Pedobacter sp.]
MKASLANPPFATDKQYTYPGKKWYAYLSAMDSVVATPLGKAENGKTDFIHLKAGKGSLYLHLSPFTFTNYFLLREKNLQYYEQALSVLPNDSKQVVWDEYFVKKKERKQRESQNWFAAVLKQPGLGEGILLAIGLMLLYVLLELRRKQRPIPVIDRPRNDSLDFVRTIGRLYYDTGDHKNLATKMSGYFLEHIRTKYKIATGELNEAFIAKLQFKTGVQEQEIAGIVNAIRNIDAAPAVSEQQLLQFHKQLEEFYTKA